MKIIFIKDCGHRKEGTIQESEPKHAAQYMAGGFAEMYVEPKPEPVVEPVVEEPKKPAPKKPAKPKAKKE